MYVIILFLYPLVFSENRQGSVLQLEGSPEPSHLSISSFPLSPTGPARQVLAKSDVRVSLNTESPCEDKVSVLTPAPNYRCK